MPADDSNINEKLGAVQAAIAVCAALAEPRSPAPGAGVYAIVPAGYRLESLQDFMPRPQRIQQNVELHDAASFIAYVQEFGDHDTSRIFFDQGHGTFHAVIDYHGGNGDPGWCRHGARFTARHSVEFATWLGMNRKQMTQVEFAHFLEENMPDVVDPNSADLLQMALTFEAKKTVEFSSGVRLNNGQIQFQYDEVVRGAAQKGTIEVPELFVLGISIHVNGPAYRISVRLRWRLQEGKVVFWYELVRPHRYIEDALREIRERIGQETGLGVLAGVAK
jgi:uncharacterized protein YfdQ (DUF2303 family)